MPSFASKYPFSKECLSYCSTSPLLQSHSLLLIWLQGHWVRTEVLMLPGYLQECVYFGKLERVSGKWKLLTKRAVSGSEESAASAGHFLTAFKLGTRQFSSAFRVILKITHMHQACENTLWYNKIKCTKDR